MDLAMDKGDGHSSWVRFPYYHLKTWAGARLSQAQGTLRSSGSAALLRHS